MNIHDMMCFVDFRTAFNGMHHAYGYRPAEHAVSENTMSCNIPIKLVIEHAEYYLLKAMQACARRRQNNLWMLSSTEECCKAIACPM